MCRTHSIRKAPQGLPSLTAIFAILALFLTSAPSASALPEKFFGVQWSPSQTTYDMEAIARSGAKYYHLQLSRTSNVAAAYDPIFQFAWEKGITILPYLYSGGATGPQYPTLEQLEKEGSGPGTCIYFVYEVVHRYGFQGDFWYGKSNPKPVPEWEIWKEPNLRKNNPGGVSVYPEIYTLFARRMAIAIQEAQKERSGQGTGVNFGNLISAATSMEGSNYASMDVRLFLEKAVNVDPGGSNFTGLALHPYSFVGGSTGVETNVNTAREKLTQFFGSTKEIWITELGWLAEGGDTKHPASGETLQSQYLTQSFNWIRSVQATKNIQSLIYYNYHDFASGKWDEHAGLRRNDDSFRPAWYAFEEQTGAPKWPILLPQPTRKPAAFISPDGTENVFVTTSGGVNHYLKSPGKTWGGEVVDAETFTSAPSAFISPNGNENVFVTTSGGINHCLKSPGKTWGGEIVATGSFASTPV